MRDVVKRGSIRTRQLLIDSLDSVFRPNSKVNGSSMAQEFPHLFSNDNIKNTYYIEKEGKPVSQASVFISTIFLNGISLKVASLGSVSTLKEYRHQGFSTNIIEEIIKQNSKAKIDLLLVSGELELYKKLECVKVGRVIRGSIDTRNKGVNYEIKLINPENRKLRADTYHELYRKEKYRFLRTKSHFRILLDSLWFRRVNYRMEFFEINQNNITVAYVVAFKKNEDNTVIIMEYAGSRNALIESIPTINERMDGDKIVFNIHPDDITLIEICKKNKIQMIESFTQGTIRILNEESLFRKLQPIFIEHFGQSYKLEKKDVNAWNLVAKKSMKKIEGTGNLTRLIFGYESNDLKIPLVFTDDLNYI
jgi:predicted acetyltransferase